MEISYQAGDELTTDTSIATYDNADSVTITVSVSEEDISEITIGDNVNIELTAYGDTVFEGVVQSMDTSVSSGSSTVSYQVTLRLVWINITQNKFKVIMTSIGVTVGASTIVMVIAIGKGGQADVEDQFKNLNAGAIDIS